MKPNILFFNEFEVSPNFGGIERVTSSIAGALIKEGYQVHSAYVDTIPQNYERTQFCSKFQIDIKDISSFAKYLSTQDVNIIILQNTFKRFDYISKAINQCSHTIKKIFAHHMLPESEYSFLRFHEYKKSIFNSFFYYPRDILRLIKWTVNYPLFKHQWRNNYRKIYNKCDCIVLLSEEYIEDWKNFAKISSISKFKIIPNARTFDHSFEIANYSSIKDISDANEGNILIVSRLEEQQKKISIALNIFKEIEQLYPQWNLIIVGEGPDSSLYRKYVIENHIKNVHFMGMQKPLTYYAKSSIFMMTSDHEAFPLTLLEAQQMGCIPIAFNTFGSVNTIIKDKVTGYIISKGDINEYISHLKLLIENPNLRKVMASKAIKHSENFAPTKIYEIWKHLFLNLTD